MSFVDKYAVLLIGTKLEQDVPCAAAGKVTLCAGKEPYPYLDMVTLDLSSCTWSVQSTPAKNACEGVRQYIEKEERFSLFHSIV